MEIIRSVSLDIAEHISHLLKQNSTRKTDPIITVIEEKKPKGKRKSSNVKCLFSIYVHSNTRLSFFYATAFLRCQINAYTNLNSSLLSPSSIFTYESSSPY
jgi:hypothetical protein